MQRRESLTYLGEGSDNAILKGLFWMQKIALLYETGFRKAG